MIILGVDKKYTLKIFILPVIHSSSSSILLTFIVDSWLITIRKFIVSFFFYECLRFNFSTVVDKIIKYLFLGSKISSTNKNKLVGRLSKQARQTYIPGYFWINSEARIALWYILVVRSLWMMWILLEVLEYMHIIHEIILYFIETKNQCMLEVIYKTHAYKMYSPENLKKEWR